MFLLQNIKPAETAALIVMGYRRVEYLLFSSTFPLVVVEDSLVSLHDVGEEESSARVTL